MKYGKKTLENPFNDNQRKNFNSVKNTQEFVKIVCIGYFWCFDMFTQSIKLYTLYGHLSKSTHLSRWFIK